MSLFRAVSLAFAALTTPGTSSDSAQFYFAAYRHSAGAESGDPLALRVLVFRVFFFFGESVINTPTFD